MSAAAHRARLAERASRYAEWAFATCVLLWLSQALDVVLYQRAGPFWLVPRFFSPVAFHSAIVAGSVVTLLLIAFRWQGAKPLCGDAWPLFVPVGLALVSALWSVVPRWTILSASELLGATAFGIFLAVRFSLDEQLTVLGLALAIAACASAVVALVWPQYGIAVTGHPGAWTGVFMEKNRLGRAMALAALEFLVLAWGMRQLRLTALSACALSIALVIRSESRGGLALTIAGGTLVGVLALLRTRAPATRKTVSLLLAGSALVAGVIIARYAAAILALVGRDTTLSFRTAIWRAVVGAVHARPWLGYGYGAFWRSDVAAAVRNTVGWMWHAHNGLLDLTLALGVVGLVSFVIAYLLFLKRAVAWSMDGSSDSCVWPAAYLAFFLLSNLAESALVQENIIFWPLYVASVLTVQRARYRDADSDSWKSQHNAPV